MWNVASPSFARRRPVILPIVIRQQIILLNIKVDIALFALNILTEWLSVFTLAERSDKHCYSSVDEQYGVGVLSLSTCHDWIQRKFYEQVNKKGCPVLSHLLS